VNNNEKLTKELKLVSEGITLFTDYHRNESVLANKTFMKEMELFLNKHNISYTKCDIVEDILLQCAEATLGTQGKKQFRVGEDSSRLVFKFEDMTQENADLFVKFFLDVGDETATKGKGSREYGSSIPESCMLQTASYTPSTPVKKLESHSIEVDGKFFYDFIFSLIKEQIDSLSRIAPHSLSIYKEASHDYLLEKFAKENPKISDNKVLFFQQAQILEEYPNDTEKDYLYFAI
jgi:hypothetical protein